MQSLAFAEEGSGRGRRFSTAALDAVADTNRLVNTRSEDAELAGLLQQPMNVQD